MKKFYRLQQMVVCCLLFVVSSPIYAQDTVVKFYTGPQYGGRELALPVGDHDFTRGPYFGFKNAIQSAKISSGYVVEVFLYGRQTGRKRLLTTDITMINGPFNKRIMSVRVSKASANLQQEVVTLYNAPNYEGNSITLNSGDHDLTSGPFLPFNDKVQSIKVPVGYTVEAFSSWRQTGDNKIFVSNTPTIEGQFNNEISSLRITKLRDDDGSTVVMLYTEPNYGGSAISLDLGLYDLTSGKYLAFNDKTQSIKVPPGYMVEAFSSWRQEGNKKVFSSNTPTLESNFNKEISSLRIAKMGDGREPTAVMLFNGPHYGGTSITLDVGEYDLTSGKYFSFNDKTQSIKIPSGYTVEAFTSWRYEGNKKVFQSSTPIMDGGFNNEISSLKITSSKSPNAKQSIEPGVSAFLNKYGGLEKYNTQYVDALNTMIHVENLVKSNRYKDAKAALDKLWKKYPIGSKDWRSATIDDKKNKTNIGSPPAYNAIRMLTDIVNHNLDGVQPNGEVLTATLRVVLVGCSEGKKPRTVAEMKQGGGVTSKRALKSQLKGQNHQIIDQSLDLFLRYVTAITDGKLKVQVKYHHLDNYCIATQVKADGSKAGVMDNRDAINQLSDDMRKETDWWWVIYPSTVPEDGMDGISATAGFDKFSFNTGGIDIAPQNKPLLIINDTWLLRVPPHMGKGEISDIERRAYLPQWLQHEFFHHFYKCYPELKLEMNRHDWYTRSFWASDFVGMYESDYYQETMHKRLQSAKPFLQFKLKPTYKPSAALLSSLKLDQFLNRTFDASESIRKRGITPNDYHKGQIIKIGSQYYWKNAAGKQWEVRPNLRKGEFTNTSDVDYKGKHFDIRLKKDATGAYVNQIEGLFFDSTLYRLR